MGRLCNSQHKQPIDKKDTGGDHKFNDTVLISPHKMDDLQSFCCCQQQNKNKLGNDLIYKKGVNSIRKDSKKGQFTDLAIHLHRTKR